MEVGSVKILGGVGYILLLIGTIISIIPYGGIVLLMGFIGLILIAIAWLALGSMLKETLMKVFGILSIITCALAIVSVIILFITLAPLFTTMPGFVGPMEPTLEGIELIPSEAINVLGGFIVFVILLLITVILGIITTILHIVVHFRASSSTKINMFKWAGITYIVSIVLAIIGIIALFAGALSMTGTIMMPGGEPAYLEEIISRLFLVFLPALIVLVIGGIIQMVAYVLSAVSFFSLSKIETKTEVPKEITQQLAA